MFSFCCFWFFNIDFHSKFTFLLKWRCTAKTWPYHVRDLENNTSSLENLQTIIFHGDTLKAKDSLNETHENSVHFINLFFFLELEDCQQIVTIHRLLTAMLVITLLTAISAFGTSIFGCFSVCCSVSPLLTSFISFWKTHWEQRQKFLNFIFSEVTKYSRLYFCMSILTGESFTGRLFINCYVYQLHRKDK